MALVKFIEVSSNELSSLPIVEGRFTFTDDGKFYLDSSNSSGEIERFSINGDKVFSDTTAGWSAQSSLISEKNNIYIYTDYQTSADGGYVPGIKVGDGLAYVVDLPFADVLFQEHIANTDIHITAEEREFWNNKVSVSLDLDNPTNLILSTD